MAYNDRKSLLCPRCRRLVSRDEPRCPYCGIRNPGAWWKNNPAFRAFADPDVILRAVIALNVVMYVLSLVMNERLSGLSANPFALLSVENRSLLLLGATGTIPILRFGRFWTLISAMYLHGGLLHILFNMLALRQLAPAVFREFGVNRTTVIYTLGGAAGFWISFRAGVPFTMGASGALCALIGALLYYGLSRGGLYGQVLFRQVGGWAIGILVLGLLLPGINNWAHGGGMMAGLALAYFLGYREKRREAAADRILGVACTLLTLAILFWAVFSGILQWMNG